jgi:hypothetical protein
MELVFKKHGNITVALLETREQVIQDVDDAVDLMGNASYQGASAVILYEENFDARFFDLSTRIAGDILQKFSNYRMKLAIVGDFSKYKSKSLRDFIRESNKNRHILFVNSMAEGLEKIG